MDINQEFAIVRTERAGDKEFTLCYKNYEDYKNDVGAVEEELPEDMMDYHTELVFPWSKYQDDVEDLEFWMQVLARNYNPFSEGYIKEFIKLYNIIYHTEVEFVGEIRFALVLKNKPEDDQKFLDIIKYFLPVGVGVEFLL